MELHNDNSNSIKELLKNIQNSLNNLNNHIKNIDEENKKIIYRLKIYLKNIII